MTQPEPSFPSPPPAVESLADDVIALRLLRVLPAGDAAGRPPETRFLAGALECRFTIHRRSDDERVGRIHIRLTDDLAILRAVGHTGYAVDEAHRRNGYATRALVLMRGIARHYGVAPLWVLIEPQNAASRGAAEGAGLRLIDVVPAAPETRALGHGPEVCRYAAEQP